RAHLHRDRHPIRVVDERPSDVVEELLHADASPSPSLSPSALASGAAAGSASASAVPVASSAATFDPALAVAFARALGAGRAVALVGVFRARGFAASSEASPFPSSPPCRRGRTARAAGRARFPV